MSVRSAWLLPGGAEPGQTREDTRLSPVGTMSPAGELISRGGAVPGGDPFAASGAGAMSLQVGVGRAVVQGTTAQGAYPIAVDAPVVVTFDDGEAVLDRIDTVVVRVSDQLFDVSGENAARVEVIKGTPLADPTPPTLDPACLPLWDVTVPAGTSAGVGGIDWGTALADRRRYTVAVGGITPPGDTATDGAYVGQWRDHDGILERWDGTAWVVRSPHSGAAFEADVTLGTSRRVRFGTDTSLYRSAAGVLRTDGTIRSGTHQLRAGLADSVNVSFTSKASHTVVVAFSTPFASQPIMSTAIASGAGETGRWGVRPIQITSTGFTIFVFDTVLPTTNQTWSNIPVHWTAWAR